MRERDEEMEDREGHMETAEGGGRETGRETDHAIDEGHMETEKDRGTETADVMLEFVQEEGANSGQEEETEEDRGSETVDIEPVQEGGVESGMEEDAKTPQEEEKDRDVDNWKRNRRKRLRNSGQSYINSHSIHVPRRKVRERNCASCRYKCNQNFPEPVRESIFQHYWEMGDAARQKDFIVNLVIKRGKRNSEQISRRTHSFEYYLTFEGRQIRVCKDFFLKTLDMSEKFARSAGGHPSS